MSDGPLLPTGKLRVCSTLCSTCIFRPGNLMQLNEGRRDGMVTECLRNDSAIPCHKTLDGERAVCRGFWQRYKHDVLIGRIGMIYGEIFVDPDAEEYA